MAEAVSFKPRALNKNLGKMPHSYPKNKTPFSLLLASNLSWTEMEQENQKELFFFFLHCWQYGNCSTCLPARTQSVTHLSPVYPRSWLSDPVNGRILMPETFIPFSLLQNTMQSQCNLDFSIFPIIYLYFAWFYHLYNHFARVQTGHKVCSRLKHCFPNFSKHANIPKILLKYKCQGSSLLVRESYILTKKKEWIGAVGPRP